MSHYETVRVRPIPFDVIDALARNGAEPLEVYRARTTTRHGLTLTPVTLTPEPISSKVAAGAEYPHHVVYLAVPDDSPSAMQSHTVDRTQVVGHALDLTGVSLFNGRSRLTLFTTAEAERSAELVRKAKAPAKTREALFVRDDAGEEMPLTPVYGAKLSVGAVVRGVSAEEVALRAEKALLAEFGDALGETRTVAAKEAEDLRVDVYDSKDKKELLATDVLAAEVSFLVPGKPFIEETRTD